MFKGKKVDAKDVINFKDKILGIILKDIQELSILSKEDLISVWSFFKFIATDWENQLPKEEEIIFATHKNSIIGKHKKILEKRCNITIKFIEEI